MALGFTEKTTNFIYRQQSTLKKSIHNFLQALLSINDMYVLAQNRISTLFFEEVANFFDALDIRYTQNINLEGQTHLTHKFDFLITKSKIHKERLIKILNTPKKENLQSNLFAFLDLPLQRQQTTDKIIIFNDQNTNITDSLLKAPQELGIKTIEWSKKKDASSYLVS